MTLRLLYVKLLDGNRTDDYFRDSERKGKRREGGESLSASACVRRSVANGGRRRGGSAKKQRK